MPPISSEGISPKRDEGEAAGSDPAEPDGEAEHFGDVGDVRLGKAEVDVKRVGHHARRRSLAGDKSPAQQEQDAVPRRGALKNSFNGSA